MAIYNEYNPIRMVGNSYVKCPSSYTYKLEDVSAADAGRTEDAKMWKNRIAQKEKISLKWNAPTPEVASKVLSAFNNEYFDVTYRNPLSNSVMTKTFYRGDANAPTYWWCNGGLFQNVSFDIIER